MFPMRKVINGFTVAQARTNQSDVVGNTGSGFHRIGAIHTEASKGGDLIDRLVRMTPSAQILFRRMKLGYNWRTGICTYQRTQEELVRNSSAYKAFSQRYREIKNQELLIRLPKPVARDLHLPETGLYLMVNPDIILPADNVRDRNRRIWNSLAK